MIKNLHDYNNLIYKAILTPLFYNNLYKNIIIIIITKIINYYNYNINYYKKDNNLLLNIFNE